MATRSNDASGASGRAGEVAPREAETHQRHDRARWSRALIFALIVQVLALYWPFGLDLPFSLPQQDSGLPTDKLVHVVLFAVPAYCGLRWGQATGRAWIAAAVIVGLGLHAGVSEIVQGAVLARQRDAVDAMADAAGILIGAGWARVRAGR